MASADVTACGEDIAKNGLTKLRADAGDSAGAPLANSLYGYDNLLRPHIGHNLNYQFRNASNESHQKTLQPKLLQADRHLCSPSRPDHDTPVEVFSMSKVITGFLAVMSMDIFEQLGIENWAPETNVFDYAESKELTRAQRAERPNVSVRQCLTHTGGFGMSYPAAFKNHNKRQVGVFNYGTGYDVVGHILPRVWRKSGLKFDHPDGATFRQPSEWQTLDDVAQHLLFQPLDMTKSKFVGFMAVPFGCECGLFPKWLNAQQGGASFASSANDFAKFTVLLLNKGGVKSAGIQTRPGFAVRRPAHCAFDASQSAASTVLLGRPEFIRLETFNKLCLTNQLPEGKSSGDLGQGTGLGDSSYGHSLIAAVSDRTENERNKPITVRARCGPRTFSKYVTPPPEKPATILYWRGIFGSVWEVNYSKNLTYSKIGRDWLPLCCMSGICWNLGLKRSDRVELYGAIRGASCSPMAPAGFNHAIFGGNVGNVFDNVGEVLNPPEARKQLWSGLSSTAHEDDNKSNRKCACCMM